MDIKFERKVRQARVAQQRRGGGGGRKRCRKGKSCGASCISSVKVCLVDVSDNVSKEIGKVAREVIGRIPAGTQRKSKMRELLSQEKLQALSKAEINRAIRSFADYMKSNPANNNRANRDSLLMLRALRAGVSSKGESSTTNPPKSQSSSKYSKVPGSSKPIAKEDTAKIAERLRKEIKDLDDRINAITGQTAIDMLNKTTLTKEKYDLGDQLKLVEGGSTSNISLSSVYNMQGFNAKPELVESRSELERSGKILKNADGSPLILYRGVSEVPFSEQFKGLGSEGAFHYPGRGGLGDGSYAASASNPNREGAKPSDSYARHTAKMYANYSDFSQKVIAFGLRSDANVIEFKNMEDFNKWSLNILTEAQSKTGYRFNNVGTAAAAMGIHAYRVPVDDLVDYWVVLNRGAVIAAKNSEIS